MTVVAEKSAVTMQQPWLKPAPPRSPNRRARERLREGLQDWAAGLVGHRRLIALSVVFIAVALCSNYYCGGYVSSTSGVKVPDLVLDHLDPIDLSFLFVYGYTALIVGLFLYPLLFRVRILHVAAIQFSLLLILRSLFMVFTHLETPAGSVSVGFPWFFRILYFDNDMFFSGHTAIPFLGFYLFKGSSLRYVFLVGSVVMGIVVLAMHLHYSIDVFAAFFMTYCSYRIGNAVIRRIDPTYCV